MPRRCPRPGRLAWAEAGCDPLTVGYYLRFLCEDDKPLSPGEIISGLRDTDPGFTLDEDGSLSRGSALLAHIDVSQAGDGLFDDELGELREEAGRGAAASTVTRRLGTVSAILTARVLWQDRETEETLDLLSPLWDWLLAHRRGLIHADGEGFYDGQDLILPAS